jgi:hypothetical protein
MIICSLATFSRDEHLMTDSPMARLRGAVVEAQRGYDMSGARRVCAKRSQAIAARLTHSVYSTVCLLQPIAV